MLQAAVETGHLALLPAAAGIKALTPPLAVDLDGTLVNTDTLSEGLIDYVKARPRNLMLLGRALLRGKAAFKREVAALTVFDPKTTPYNSELLSFLAAQKKESRRLGLFSAADQAIVDSVAAHIGMFDVVRGSDGHNNLAGKAKLAAICEEFGANFTYAGDAAVDRPVFDAAEGVILVGPVARLRALLSRDKFIEAEFPGRASNLRAWVSALRLKHWVKNLLIFVAPVLGFHIVRPEILVQSMLLFLLMGALASATYIINDLLDLAADRRHPKKRFRPFAAGTIPIRSGAIVAITMLAGTFAVGAAMLPGAAVLALAAYLALTLGYSTVLKQKPMIDVLVLAVLFTIRIIAGGALLAIPASPWLLTFSTLFFLGLAMVKRYAELERVLRTDMAAAKARGYTSLDLPILSSTGMASGLAAVVIFTIYLIEEQYPHHIYRHPAALWGMVPLLLLWILRVWHLSVHGQMNEDPVVFALKDRFSLVLCVIVCAVLAAAWL